MAAACSELQRACHKTVSVGQSRACLRFAYHMYELIWLLRHPEKVNPHLHISYMEV